MSCSLISWGANSHGQLGQGIRSEECLSPREVDLSKCPLEAEKIKKIVGGAGHTLILDDYGRVYSCGWNDKGQAGFSVKGDILTVRELNRKLRTKVVVDIACGWDCSAALTMDGTLFLWGSNAFGQLGNHPNDLQWTHDPFEVVIDRKIKGISIGLRHTALVTQDYKLLVAGAGSKGQLGLGFPKNEKNSRAVYAFTEVTTLTNVEDASCGQHHTIAVTKNGDVYAFGDNKHGQLGLSTDTIRETSSPIKLSDLRLKSPIKVHSGWSHVIALSDGEMFGWGRNTYGQLGTTEVGTSATWIPVRIENLSKVQQVSVGSEHNTALTEDGRIFCCGWNEHGNCGNGATTNVTLPAEIVLPYEYTGRLVGSGAGHSFAVIKKT